MSNYVIWKNVSVPHACSLTDFSGIDNTFPLRSCQPLANTFPDDTTFHMRPDNPQDTLLTDSLRNTESILVVSPEITDFVRDYPVSHVELLAVRILDHKNKLVKRAYHILHPVGPVDCMDLAKSEPSFSLILKTRINKVKRIVLDEDRVDSDRLIFRCLNFYDVTLVRRDFAAAVTDRGFTGFRWMELDEWT